MVSLPLNNSLWQGKGAFVWNPWEVDPHVLGERLRGFDYVAMMVHDSLSWPQFYDPLWLTAFRTTNPNIRICYWGVLRNAPEQEAALAKSLLTKYNSTCYIANAEAEYEQFKGNYDNSARFIRAWGRTPELSIALTSYPVADREAINWSVWQEGGWDFFPQAYVNDFGDFGSPRNCVLGGIRAGWYENRIHPLIGLFDGRLGRLPARDYIPWLKVDGAKGYSFYLVEAKTTVDDYAIMRGYTDG